MINRHKIVDLVFNQAYLKRKTKIILIESVPKEVRKKTTKTPDNLYRVLI